MIDNFNNVELGPYYRDEIIEMYKVFIQLLEREDVVEPKDLIDWL